VNLITYMHTMCSRAIHIQCYVENEFLTHLQHESGRFPVAAQKTGPLAFRNGMVF